MSYKTELQSNNLDLQAILDAVNELPEIDKSKQLITTVTGDGFVHLDDVSEVPHDITIEAAAGTKVTVTGKNLFDDVTFYEENGFVKEADGWIAHSVVKDIWKNTSQIKGALTLSMWTKEEASRAVITVIYYTDGTYVFGGEIGGNHQEWTQFAYVTDATKTVDRIMYSYGGSGGTYLVKETQISVGTSSMYEPYVEPIEAIAPATIKSNPPNMYFFADSSLTIGYNKSWGINEEKKRLWKSIQDNGKRYWYSSAFAWWTDDNSYTPMYPIENAYVYGMFANSNISDTKVPISVYSGSENAYKSAGNLFANCRRLITIQSLDITHATSVGNAFASCGNLVNLTMVGAIANAIDLQWSPKLSRASIESVVNALSSTTSGLSVTFSKTAVNSAFTTAEWNTLAATKSNWTISLV